MVEDNAINREFAQAALEAMGYRVDLACDGEEAVSMVQTHAYELVSMDVEMPTMEGRTAIGHIRAFSGAARSVPIVAMTAHVLPEQIAELRSAGADDHIGKLFDRAHRRTNIGCGLRDGHARRAA